FHLVVELLEDDFRVHEAEDDPTRIERVERRVRALDPALEWTIPYLKHLLAVPAGELAEGGLDQAQQKRRLGDAVRAFTLRGAQRTPLVRLCEGLQWVDPNSEELLGLLADGIAGRPVMIIGTYRSGYTPPWQARSFHHRLVLEPLSRDEAEGMVQSLAGDADSAVRQMVVGRAVGNPFFLEELPRDVRERGHAGEGAGPPHGADRSAARADQTSPAGCRRARAGVPAIRLEGAGPGWGRRAGHHRAGEPRAAARKGRGAGAALRLQSSSRAGGR